jgi:hypothetical protein
MSVVDKDVEFKVIVDEKSKYSLEFRIGFEQPGSIKKYGNAIKTEPEPTSGASTWAPDIGKGKKLVGQTLEVYITTKNENTAFNDVGFVLLMTNLNTGINEELKPLEAESNIVKSVGDRNSIVFKIKVKFV